MTNERPAAIASLPPIEKQIDLSGIRNGSKPTIRLDPPAEIALKKLHYRATMLKPRDVFDISVTDAIDGDALIANLHEVAEKKDDLLRRLFDATQEDGDRGRARSACYNIRPLLCVNASRITAGPEMSKLVNPRSRGASEGRPGSECPPPSTR
jgi:hypothetical protein